MATPMMLKKFYLSNTDATDSITISGSFVITNITVTNVSSHSNSFSIFRTPAIEASTGAFQDDCRVIKEKNIGSGETVVLENLRWVLSNGDKIGVQRHTFTVGRDLLFYIDGVFID